MSEDQWIDRLAERNDSGNLRRLSVSEGKADFVSNDYLGLARNMDLYRQIREKTDASVQVNKNGSGGSRLLSGNSSLYEKTEDFLADIFNAESTLIFNSGYQANLALLSSIPQKGDTILYDQLSHICLKEGAWLSKADSVMFAHNDCDDLQRKLALAEGDKYVVIESIYSMDGDFAPLHKMIALCEAYNAKLIIDEAHSTGVLGKGGSGWCVEERVSDQLFARVYTFGKGMGIHGACIAGSHRMKQFLVNFARPFIYTTALPLHSVVSIEQSFSFLAENEHLQDDLKEKISYFRQKITSLSANWNTATYPGSNSAIQPVIIPGNETIKQISEHLQHKNLDVRPILSPTVKRGKERLRISLHTYNTFEEIDLLVEQLSQLL